MGRLVIEYSVTVDEEDKKRLMNDMDQMMRRVDDWRPFWSIAQAQLHRSVLANFRAQGRPVAWKALSGWTLRVRAKERSHALGGKILQASGALRQSIGNVNEKTWTTFRYGTNLAYARLQNYGTAGLPGGVLKPKTGKYLALPFPGVKGSPRDYENTFVLTTSKSKTIWQKMDGGKSHPLFLLKKSVVIPARPFILYQSEDVDRILSYAMAYVTNPERFSGLRSTSK